MIYVIMCGGQYDHFGDLPRALHEVQGEPLVARTIRQLKALGVDENLIFITASDPRFKKYGVVLQHENSYRADGEKNYGYWLDALIHLALFVNDKMGFIWIAGASGNMSAKSEVAILVSGIVLLVIAFSHEL